MKLLLVSVLIHWGSAVHYSNQYRYSWSTDHFLNVHQTSHFGNCNNDNSKKTKTNHIYCFLLPAPIMRTAHIFLALIVALSLILDCSRADKNPTSSVCQCSAPRPGREFCGRDGKIYKSRCLARCSGTRACNMRKSSCVCLPGNMNPWESHIFASTRSTHFPKMLLPKTKVT